MRCLSLPARCAAVLRTSRLAACAVVCAAAGALGCGGRNPLQPDPQLRGTYALQTLNGAPAPAVVRDDAGGRLELVSDTYTFSGDGTFTEQTATRLTLGGTVHIDATRDTGTWALDGTALEVTYDADGTVVTGTLSGGNTITAAENGFALVFRR